MARKRLEDERRARKISIISLFPRCLCMRGDFLNLYNCRHIEYPLLNEIIVFLFCRHGNQTTQTFLDIDVLSVSTYIVWAF